jgi:hypothetical protein
VAAERRADDTPGRTRRLEPGSLVTLAVVSVVLFWVPVVTALRFTARNDEAAFHLPIVRRFADHFPTIRELSSPWLSFLPLLHGVLGLLSRLVGTSDQALRGLMIPVGLMAILMYGWMVARLLDLDWRRAVLALAVFPYFGAMYFTVHTDVPAFFGLIIGLFGQLWYLRTGRVGALWLAAGGGVVACLIRQNLIFSTAVFVMLMFLLGRRPAPARDRARWQWLPGGVALLPLVLPFLAVALQVWMWKGLMPAYFRHAPGYFDRSPTTWLLNVLSLGANTGYYLLPVSVALALRDRRITGRWTWFAIGGFALAAALTCLLLRGPGLVGIFGTFRRVLEFLADHFGTWASFLAMYASLLSFGWIARCAWTWLAATRRGDIRPALVAGTLACGYLVLGYGLNRLYERHVLPLYALAVIVLLGGTSAAAGRSRLARIGWAAAALFGLAHSVAYSLHSYGIVWRVDAIRF